MQLSERDVRFFESRYSRMDVLWMCIISVVSQVLIRLAFGL